jgi:hypothetical protein
MHVSEQTEPPHSWTSLQEARNAVGVNGRWTGTYPIEYTRNIDTLSWFLLTPSDYHNMR